MSKLKLATEAYVEDANIRGILRNLAQYDEKYSDHIIYFTEETETSLIEVHTSLYEKLEELLSEVQDCNDNGEEHDEFEESDIGVITELMEILREVESNNMTYFICK